jgi:uncharacterized protein YjdB
MPQRSSSARALAIRLSSRLVRRRSLRSRIRSIARWLPLIVITQQISCSGGAGGGPPVTNKVSPAPSITISLSPTSAQIAAGASVQFVVTVQNSSNPAVTWQVNGIPGGSPSVGTITPSGAATASYAAPANVSSSLMVTVAAVLQADSTTAGSAIVTIDPPPAPQTTVSPSNPRVVTGASQQFIATVLNAPQPVIWEVDAVPGGNSTVGLINSSGFYTSPASIPNSGMVTVTAILQADLSSSGSTSVTIIAPPVGVSISPSTANVAANAILQFTASVQNSSAPIIWQVNGTPGGNPALGFGTITVSGDYSAQPLFRIHRP